MFSEKLSSDEENQFDELVMRSVASRFVGDLERHEDLRGKIGDLYTPFNDNTELRELLIELWGERLLLDAIDRIEDWLLEVGLEREAWAKAWCEEDLEAEDEAAADAMDRLEAQKREALTYEDESPL